MRPLVRAALEVVRDEQIVVEIAGAGENILMKASKGLQEAGETFDISKTVIAEPKINKVIRSLVPTWVDIQSLIKKFEGQVMVNGKSVHIDYEHLFSIGEKSVIKRSGHISNPKLYGWHHDYGRRLEKLGTIAYENIVEGACGAFEADAIVHGVKYGKKTFFNPLWTEEQVIEKIFEVFQGSHLSSLEDYTGCKIINGLTRCGLEIRMVYDPMKSLITTAFPIIR